MAPLDIGDDASGQDEAGGGGSLADRMAAWRDRLLADPRFRRAAAAFPLTRPLARRRVRQLFDICAGFVYTQTLTACVELDVFGILAEGPRSEAALAVRLGLPPEGVDRLMRAAAGLELVERRSGGRWGLGPLGASVAGDPAIPAMVRHHRMLYADLADPVALLRGERDDGALAAYWPYAKSAAPDALAEDRIAAYSGLMSASQPMIADEALAAYDFGRHRRLLDVGGGEGRFLSAVGARHPRLELRLFDLPAVAARAEARFAAAGFGDRAAATGGDFHADPLPEGADAISFVRILHDHDDAEVAALLRKARAALPPGGTLIVVEPMADTPGAEPIGDTYFGLYLRAMGTGRPRRPDELKAFLEGAGFDRIRLRKTRTPLLARVMTASVS